MKRLKQTLEKTRIVDRAFIGKEALESIVDQVNKYYVSIWNGHDPRLPPIGRVVSAELVKTGEESYEVVGDQEFFDETTSLDDVGCKEIKLKKFPEEKLQIVYDKNFLNAEDQRYISEIGNIFNSEPRKEEKHTIDHVSIITICASFAFGAIATGFLKKLGEDSYSVLKEKLSKLFSNDKNEKVLIFEFCIEKDGYLINTEIFSTNPSVQDIEYLLSNGLKYFEKQLLPIYFDKDLSLRRLVFEQKKGNIKLKFSVRKDGVPIDNANQKII